MRHVAAVVVMSLSAAALLAQQPAVGNTARGHFGAPVLEYTTLRGQGALMLGGRGGWNLTPSLVLGFGVYGTVSEVDGPAGVPFAPGPLYVKMESFGVEVEHAFRPAAPTHLTVGVFAGGAAAHYMQEATDEQHGETDFMLLLKPAVGVERRLTDRLHLHLSASYRLVSGVEQPGLATGDVSGAAVALALKIGRF